MIFSDIVDWFKDYRADKKRLEMLSLYYRDEAKFREKVNCPPDVPIYLFTVRSTADKPVMQNAGEYFTYKGKIYEALQNVLALPDKERSFLVRYHCTIEEWNAAHPDAIVPPEDDTPQPEKPPQKKKSRRRRRKKG